MGLDFECICKAGCVSEMWTMDCGLVGELEVVMMRKRYSSKRGNEDGEREKKAQGFERTVK